MSGSGGVVFIKGSSGNVADVTAAGLLKVDIGSASVNVDISGETVKAEISGQQVALNQTDLSGLAMRAAIISQTGGLTASVNTANVDNATPGARVALNTIAFSHLYDRTNDVWLRGENNGLSGRGIAAVAVEPTTALITGDEISCTGASGGTQLPSGKSVSVTVKMTQGQTGVIRIGGVGDQAPYSGKGLVLGPGDSYTVNVRNPNMIRAHASVSGEKLSWIANQYA